MRVNEAVARTRTSEGLLRACDDDGPDILVGVDQAQGSLEFAEQRDVGALSTSNGGPERHKRTPSILRLRAKRPGIPRWEALDVCGSSEALDINAVISR